MFFKQQSRSLTGNWVEMLLRTFPASSYICSKDAHGWIIASFKRDEGATWLDGQAGIDGRIHAYRYSHSATAKTTKWHFENTEKLSIQFMWRTPGDGAVQRNEGCSHSYGIKRTEEATGMLIYFVPDKSIGWNLFMNFVHAASIAVTLHWPRGGKCQAPTLVGFKWWERVQRE